MKCVDRILLAVALLVLPDTALAKAPLVMTNLKSHGNEFMAYSVIADDIDGDGRSEIIAGSFDHRVYVLDSEARILWSYNVGGLPFALATGDVNNDGKKDIVAVVQNSPSSVIALEYKKGILWTFTDDLPFLSVAVGDFGGRGRKQIAAGSFLGALYVLDSHGTVTFKKTFSADSLICALEFGDLDRVPGEELVVGTSRDGVYGLNNKGEILWHAEAKSLRNKDKEEGTKKDKKRDKKKDKKKTRVKEGKKSKKLHPRNKMENIQSICVTDLTGDGEEEVIIGSRPSGLVTVLNGKGDLLWQKNFPQMMNDRSSAFIAVGNFIGDTPKELFCLLNGVVLSGRKGTSPFVMLDSHGAEIGDYHPLSAFFSICSGYVDKTGYERVIMSSSVRGHGINLVSFGEGKGQDSSALSKDISQMNIEPYLNRIKTTAAKTIKAKRTRNFHFLYRTNYRDIYGKNAKEFEQLLKPLRSIPGDNAVVVTSLYEEKLSRNLRGGKPRKFLSSSNIEEMAAWFEKNKIPFFLDIGKHAKLYISLGTLENVLQAARQSCRGFIVDENSYTRPQLWEDFLRDLDRILAMLSKYQGKKLIMNEYLGFWHRFPLDKRAFSTLFKPEYRDILVPVYKPNNMKSPELNMGVLVGLWKAGAINNWGVGIYGDMWKWASTFIGTPGDVELRFALEAISLGANYFVFARNVSQESKTTLDLDLHYKIYFETLYDLIAKGVVAPVDKPDLLVVSPVALQELANPNEIAKRRSGTQVYWQEIYRWRGSLDAGFFMQSTGQNYLTKYCYGMANYFDGLFPRNPYGYVLIFPEGIDPNKVSGIQNYYVINEDGGISKREGGALKRVQGDGSILKTFEEYGKRLPFTTPNAFLSAQKTAEGYLIYLINPSLFDTKDVRATLTINVNPGKIRLTDAISGEVLNLTKDQSLEIEIPAGLFRIIKVEHD
jgi:hypothetical protein